MRLSMYEGPMETVEYICVHAWLDFVRKLQNYTSLAYSWLTNEECKK